MFYVFSPSKDAWLQSDNLTEPSWGSFNTCAEFESRMAANDRAVLALDNGIGGVTDPFVILEDDFDA